MKRKMVFASVVATLVTLLALSTTASACWWFFYQPKVPKSLRK